MNANLNTARSYADTNINSNVSTINSSLATKLDKTGGTITGDLTITSNLIIKGTTITANTQTTLMRDNIIMINKPDSGSGADFDSGLLVSYVGSTNPGLIYRKIDRNDAVSGKINRFVLGNINITTSNLDANANPIGGNAVITDLAVLHVASLEGNMISSNLSIGNETSNVNIGSSLFLTGKEIITNTTQSTTTGTGALIVSGGVGIASNLNVGGNINFSGNLYQNGVLFTSGSGGSGVSSQWTTTGNNISYRSGDVQVGGNLIAENNLNVYGVAEFSDQLNISGKLIAGDDTEIYGITNIKTTYNSNSTTSGALVVSGGVGIGGTMNIGGNLIVNNKLLVIDTAEISSNLNIYGALNTTNINRLLNTIESTTTTTGALVVSGGVGIASNVNVGGNVNLSIGQAYYINNTNLLNSTTLGSSIVNSSLTSVGTLSGLTVSGTSTYNGPIITGTAGNVFIGNTTESTSSTTGALVVSGGLGIASNVNVGGNLIVSSNRNVGIGTSSPTNILSLFSTGPTGIDVNSSGNIGSIGVASGTTDYSTSAIRGDTVIRSNNRNLMLLSGSGAAALYINTSNNVGIGTSSPIQRLHVHGNLFVGDQFVSGSGGGSGSITLYGHSGSIADNTKPGIYNRALVGLGIHSDSAISFEVNGSTSKSEAMRILQTGYVGIGTTNPAVPLDIQLNPQFSTYYYTFLNTTVPTGFYNNTQSLATSIRALGRILASEFNTTSDRRIKSNIEIIDDKISLNKLRLIEPKKYQYVDKIKKGNAEVFGFIAQDVREQFPEAINIMTEYIPDIYSKKEYNQVAPNIIEFTDITGNIGENFRFIQYDDSFLVGNLINLSGNVATFSLDKDFIPPTDPNIVANVGSNLFVYGKQVNDFHYLNKEYLFTINFAATQEIDRIVDWHTNGNDRSVSGNASVVYGESLLLKIQRLEQENGQLKEQLNQQQEVINNILQRLVNANI
jgi:hypothetical protein